MGLVVRMARGMNFRFPWKIVDARTLYVFQIRVTLLFMNADPSCALSLSAIRRALVLAGGTLILAAACGPTPTYGPDGNVFVQPRYGYGSANQSGQPKPGDDRNYNYTKPSNRKTPDIKRDPNDTTVDVTPPESKDKKDPDTATDDTSDSPPRDTADAKPAAPREDLPIGQPVVGKKGYVYSPYAPDKGQVDVDGIPAGTKVKCPYTDKVFRVP